MKKEKILYLGLDPFHFQTDGEVVHHPIIQIIPRYYKCDVPISTTHILLTSKIAAALFLDQLETIPNVYFIAIGKITAFAMKKKGLEASIISSNESGEGIIEILEVMDLSKAHILYPHSSLSRPLIVDYLKEKNIQHTEIILYDTIVNPKPLPDIAHFDEIVFTSPSVVDAFFSYHQQMPHGKKMTAIGPITQKRMDKYL